MDQNNGRPRSAAMRERGRHDCACGRHCHCLNDIAGVEATAEEAEHQPYVQSHMAVM